MPPKKAVRRRERRRMPRADAQLSMRVDGGVGEIDVTPIVTESRNISGSGVYCISPHFLAPLSKIGLTIVLPEVPGRKAGQRLLKCEAIVVRCQMMEGAKKTKAYELACSFLNLESETRAMLDEYVVWRNLKALRDGVRDGAPRARATTGSAAGTTRRTTARRAVARAAAATATRTTRRTSARKRRTLH